MAEVGHLPRQRARVASVVNRKRPMNSQHFLDLSTKLFKDMTAWIAEAGAHHSLAPSDLALLNSAVKIVERVTLQDADARPDQVH